MTPRNSITSSSNHIDHGASQGIAMSLPEHSTFLRAEIPCGEQGQGQGMIDGLPDDVLLEIFYFCIPSRLHGISWQVSLPFRAQSWVTLTQVCRRWRFIVLGSPRHLDLRVLCTPTTHTRVLLDIWPPFPIIVHSGSFGSRVDERGVDNLTAALEHRDRISEINIDNINDHALETLIHAMHGPLAALTDFYLRSADESVPVLPETFLGGSAPHLQLFILSGIPFPSFPKFISSATNIVYLTLFDIPDSGYLSPEVMATCLAMLPNLKHLELGFRSPLSRPLHVGLPSLSNAVLPALTSLYFKGASEYFDDLLARTDIPLLRFLYMRFFMDLIFDIPRIHWFTNRTEGLKLLGHAWVGFQFKSITINLGQPPRIRLEILCEERDWQLLSLAHICHQHLSLSCVEQLTVCELYPDAPLYWKDDMDASQWLELFHPFIAVKNLYVAKQFVPFVTAALQELTGERTMEVLPVLNNLFFEGYKAPGPVQDAIKPFVSARQISDHPIIIRSDPPPRMP